MNRGNGVGGSGSDHHSTHHLAQASQGALTEDSKEKSRVKSVALEQPALLRKDQTDQRPAASIAERAISPDAPKKMLSGWLGSSWLGSLPSSPESFPSDQFRHAPRLQMPLAQINSLSGRLSVTSEKTSELAAMFRQSGDNDSARKRELVELSQRLVQAYTHLETGEGAPAPQPCLPQVAPVELSPEWQELELDNERDKKCHCQQGQSISHFEDEIARLKSVLHERDDDFREMQSLVDRTLAEQKQLEQVLDNLNSKLSRLLPRGECFDVADPEGAVKLLTTQTEYSSLGRELLLALGVDKKPEDIPVAALVGNLTKLQEAKVEQDRLAESGITDPAPYVAFWERFVETFDPTVKPSAIAPDHLLPNLLAVKGDSDRLHKIIDAFRRNGWTKGDDDLLSYLEALPSQIKQSKSK